MSDVKNLKLSFPSGLITKMDIDGGKFTMLTDYSEERGGYDISYSPWRVFLASILSCQAVNLAKYCRAHDVDYSEVKMELESHVESIVSDEFPEYHLIIDLPEDFPQEHVEPMVESFTNCPVVNHLTKLNPVLKTIVNGEKVAEQRREDKKDSL